MKRTIDYCYTVIIVIIIIINIIDVLELYMLYIILRNAILLTDLCPCKRT